MEAGAPPGQSVKDALARALASNGFTRNERPSKFLRFLVEKQLDGEGSDLKESVIGVEVFGRKPGYDPKIDGIVRTEAIRLRARLAKYYATEGSQDPLIIELPKGGYRPVFQERKREQALLVASAPAASKRSWWIGGALAAMTVVAVLASWAWVGSGPHPATVTVAVLPLENLSADPDSDYFSDGLTDEVIRNLSLIEGLTVRSRTSSLALKDTRVSVVDAGRQLAADFLVEGSVLHEGNQLRVNVALVRVSDQTRLWTNRFDRTLNDVFAVQDEISRGIASALRMKLGAGRSRYDSNVEAYDLYLRGRHAMAGFPARGRSIALSAVQYFQQAIAKDPGYAIAYAGAADALLAIDQNVVNPEAYRRAKLAAERAVELDPMLSEAQSALASIRAREYAWQAAEQGYRRAIELNPNNALAHLQLGFSVLILQERFDEGLAEVRRALALDPLSPYVNTEAGRALLWSGRADEAIEQLRHAIRLDASRGRPYDLLSRALTLKGRAAEARAVVDDAQKRGQMIPGESCEPTAAPDRQASESVGPPPNRSVRQGGGLVQPNAGDPLGVSDPEGARALADATRGPSAARALARQYLCSGNQQRALEYMEKALAQNEPGLAERVQSPEWTALRANARVASLRRKMNLPS